MTKIEKTIMENQMLIMQVLNELLHTPGVTAHRGDRNLHTELRDRAKLTFDVIKEEARK